MFEINIGGIVGQNKIVIVTVHDNNNISRQLCASIKTSEERKDSF